MLPQRNEIELKELWNIWKYNKTQRDDSNIKIVLLKT